MVAEFGWAPGPSISELFKYETVVEYGLRESNKPIGVATYRVVRVLPAEMHDEFPRPEQIAKLLERRA